MAKAQERPPALSDIQQRRETPLLGFLGTASGGMAEGESPAVPRVPRPRCRGGAGARGGPAPGRPSPAPSVPPAGPGADGRHPPGSAAQPPGQRIRPRCHLLAGALLPHPGECHRRCCHIQLRPLFLLTLADFLAATALLGTGTIPLLPAPLSVPAYAACPYGRMLTTTSYAVSFLMVVVYAFESHRTVLGGRARPPAALQERSRCLERAWQAIPYILAWLVPALTLLAQLIARGTSVADIAPVVPWDGRGSNDTFSLYCSSCLLLIHPNQDICSQSGGGKNAGLEEKIIFLLYLLLVLGCCSLLYRRVRLRCRGNAALPLLSLDRDGGFGGRSGRSVSKASLYFQLVFLLCWTPAFLLTILSFTSISPASLFVLYVSTVSKAPLPGLPGWTFVPLPRGSCDSPWGHPGQALPTVFGLEFHSLALPGTCFNRPHQEESLPCPVPPCPGCPCRDKEP
ncbi:uncharacterized protein LOC116442552 isoform X1 [Corvus moneduloides]|uniref:uncharacterized protein LOC116442552 isoform X1 n=1 Tax=Corvus moneduloides TaxID=1196302 RepID=UPI001362BF10|nr:uncharacterized protein LOC116442552 isoform X1 [Corvus moneduloides]